MKQIKEALEQSDAWRSASAEERRIVRHFVNSTIELEYGGDWNAISAWHLDGGREFGGGDQLFPGGYDQITSLLARGMDVRLGRTVAAIDPVAGGVKLGLLGGESIPKTRPALAAADWEGRLVFAGEATSADYFGMAHGALLSGQAAARLMAG
ncbi:MAG: hypothetical protein HC855_16250 [Rhizobiales bacterium]|nr:hypothetical protein [Hyphomicrobiales bacterium]